MSEPVDIPNELLRETCARHGIRAADEFLVVNALRTKGAPAACCGNDCRPCVLDVQAAESELRALLAKRSGNREPTGLA